MPTFLAPQAAPETMIFESVVADQTGPVTVGGQLRMGKPPIWPLSLLSQMKVLIFPLTITTTQLPATATDDYNTKIVGLTSGVGGCQLKVLGKKGTHGFKHN